MSRHRRPSEEETAWLVADEGHGDCLWHRYTGKSGDHLEEQARATCATLAVGWARARSSPARIRMPDHRTYWAGTASTPYGSAGTWVDDTRRTKSGSREETT